MNTPNSLVGNILIGVGSVIFAGLIIGTFIGLFYLMANHTWLICPVIVTFFFAITCYFSLSCASPFDPWSEDFVIEYWWKRYPGESVEDWKEMLRSSPSARDELMKRKSFEHLRRH